MNSKIYTGKVNHSRLAPKTHSFTYRMYALYVDLDEIPALCAQVFGFGRHIWNFVRYSRMDFHAPQTPSLKEAVQATLEKLTGIKAAGPVRMLTQLRVLNYTFNPVTFYYCFDPDEKLRGILAEIENTPWSERYCYAVPVRKEGDDKHRAGFHKNFHVSPFMPMNQEYEWEFTTPGERLGVHMKSFEENKLKFTATLQLRAQELTSRSLWKNLFVYPLMPQRVSIGIYIQALRLYLKKIPFFDHPNPESQLGLRPKQRRNTHV